MQEAEAELVRSALSSVMPYLVYSQELKELMEKLLEESSDTRVFIDKLKLAISEKSDITRRTDGQIFINELQRRLSK